MTASNKPENCASMSDVRAEIDRLDADLITLFAERASYISRAADIKAVEGLPAFIPERVDAVVANARELAIENGLDGDLFELIWKELVKNAIAMEDKQMGE